MMTIIRFILWIARFILGMALYILRNSHRVLLLVLGGFFVFTGGVMTLSVLGGFCGWPLVVLGLVLVGVGLL